MTHVYKIPLLLEPQPEGGYTVTSPVLQELVTEGDTLGEALGHVRDALIAVVELHEDLGRPLPLTASNMGSTGGVYSNTGQGSTDAKEPA